MFKGWNTSLARIGYLETAASMAKCSSDLKEIAWNVVRARISSLLLSSEPFGRVERVIYLQRKGTLFCTKSQVLLASKGHMLFFKAQLHLPTQLPDEENDSPDFSPQNFTF